MPRSHHGSAQGPPQKKIPASGKLAGIDLGFRSGHSVSGPAAAGSEAQQAGSQEQQGRRLGDGADDDIAESPAADTAADVQCLCTVTDFYTIGGIRNIVVAVGRPGV